MAERRKRDRRSNVSPPEDIGEITNDRRKDGADPRGLVEQQDRDPLRVACREFMRHRKEDVDALSRGEMSTDNFLSAGYAAERGIRDALNAEPMQPTVVDAHGVVRFRENAIVRYLLDYGVFDMNDIARLPFSRRDRRQFAQLIGYSVDGYMDLSYAQEEKPR